MGLHKRESTTNGLRMNTCEIRERGHTDLNYYQLQMKYMSAHFQISRIGLPTQVAHTGHAKTEEEAKKLIEQLMLGGGSADQADLPQPMAPSPGNTSI